MTRSRSPRPSSRRQVEIVDWLREKGRVTVEDLAAHFARDAADDPARPQRSQRRPDGGAGPRRRHGGVGRRQPRLRGAQDDRRAAQAADRRGGGAARARPFLGVHQHRHHDRGGGAGARRPHGPAGHHQQPACRGGTLPQQRHRGVRHRRHRAAERRRHRRLACREPDRASSASISPSSAPRRSTPTARCSTSTSARCRRSRAIIEHARKVVLVADSSKFARSAPVRVAHLSEIDIFVTDRLPSPAVADLCRVARRRGGRGRRADRPGCDDDVE